MSEAWETTDLLDDLLLLDQECADDAVADAVGTARATVGALDGLCGLRDLGILARAESGNLFVSNFHTIRDPNFLTLVGNVGTLTPGSLMPQSPHLTGLPFFLMWRYRSLPPGVFTTRTLLERVLYLQTITCQPWHPCHRRFVRRRRSSDGVAYGFLRL